MAEEAELSSTDLFMPNPGHQEMFKKLPGLAEKLTPHQVEDFTFIGIPTTTLTDYLVEHQNDRPHDLNEIFVIFYNELRQHTPGRSLNMLKRVIARRDEYQTTNTDPQALQEAQQLITRYQSVLAENFTKVPLTINALGRFMQQPIISELVDRYIAQYGQQPKMQDGQPTSLTCGRSLTKILNIIQTELARLTEDWNEVSKDENLTLLNQRD